jgi:hypothetical protein
VLFNLYGPTDSTSISMNWVISEKARYRMDSALKARTGIWILIKNMMDRGKKDDLFRGLPELRNSMP